MKKIIFIISIISSINLFAQDVVIQNGTVTTCTGTFLDTGLAGGNYGDNENFTFTICPDNPGQLVQLTFTEFNTQLNADIMAIFDGDDVTAPQFGQFSGGGAGSSPGFVSATPGNATGCITITFTSDAAANTVGWEADISCFEPCQTIVSQLDSATPMPNADGYIRVCPDEEITLTGSGQFSIDGTGATYEWDLGDGMTTIAGQTATFSYPNPGVYIVNLNINDTNTSGDPEGCSNTNLINQVIQVATEPDFTGTEAAEDTICFGDSTTITGVVNPVEFINDCTPPIAETTALPDGNGAVYTTCISVDCFESSQTLDDISQLIEICLNIEHSFLGDLNIRIVSPNGQDATLHGYIPGGANGGGTYLGGADDTTNGVPGVGADYCFSMAATTLLVNGPTIIAGSNPPGPSITPGTYLPEESFASLIGSPLNGEWCIEVVDNLGIDDGTIFSWGMAFDPAIQPPELSFTPVITSEGWDADPSITNTTGNTITVEPATAGNHCYTYRVTDDFGCEYTEVVCIDVLPEVIHALPNNLFVCAAGTPPFLFDLTENDAIIIAPNPNPGDFVITYHETQADADADVNAIPNPTNYAGANGQIIYVRIEYLASGCYETETFQLNFSNPPIINPVPDIEVCDDITNDGVEEFILTDQDLGILGAQDPAAYNVTYHLSFADADAGVGDLVSPYTNIANPQPIFVRVESVGDAACYIASPVAVFDLIVNPLATATQPDDMVVCDDVSNDGVALFDLTSQDADILGTQNPANYTVTYHDSQADADAGVNPLVSPYSNTSNPQTIYVRVEDNLNPTCYGSTTFELIVNLLPEVIVVSDFQVCDDDDDGFAEFTLTDKDAEVLNGQTGITVTYHETQADADAGVNDLVSPYTNLTNPQIIYIRLVDNTTNCINTTTMNLVVNSLPIANPPAALQVCDDDNDGFAQFDLTLADADVIGAQVDMSVTYHETQADADNNVNPLISPYSNIVANAQTIFARIENNTTGCSATTTLVLVVNPAPDVIAISDYELCDYNNPGDEQELFDLTTKNIEIANGQNVTISYHETLADAQANTNAIVGLYLNTSNPQTIFVRLVNNLTNCSAIGDFELIVNPLPILIAPTPLEVCDDEIPDGITEINLSIKDDEIRGGNTDYSVTYYLTQADADAGINQLAIPYTNITNPQTIYARGQDINTGCYSTVALDLVVEQAPVANVPTPLEYCDPDSDGFGVFTLTDADNEITGGAAGLTVTYHETLADAENNVNPLVSPYNNIVINTQTVYARVESATIATDCATIVALVLIVNPDPQIELDLTALEECDDDTDGITQFDLTEAEVEVLNGLDPALFTVTYHETEANAEAGTNAIVAPGAYSNITNPQTIWIRVEDNATGCYKTTSLELIVNGLPVLVQPSPLELCDVNNSGDEMEAFTLEDANAEILNGQTGISITYYETQADADAGTNPVFSPYVNTSNPQTIYIRAENDVTGCVSTITLDLRVNPLPTPATPTPLEVCDDDNDGFASFDLELRTIEIINGELDITVTYHETMADAELDQNALLSPYDNIVPDLQTVYARAENDLTGCFAIVELVLIVQPSPELPIVIDDFTICDDDDDGFAQFDLTEMDAIIYGVQDATLFDLSYHLTQADADTGANPIVNVTNFTNSTNPQIIYVRLVSIANGCITTGTFNLVVALPPVPVQPTPLEICDDDFYEDADEIATFDLTIKDTEITGGNSSWIVNYYETDADAQADTNAIDPADAYMNTSVNGNPANPQTLYVRVTDTDTDCFAFTTLTLRVLPNPTPSQDPEDIALCDDTISGDGLEVFDLTINEAYIINGEVGVTVTYHETPEDADMGTNAIADPTMYTNIETPSQTIYVRVTNDTTGCYTIVTFNIIVNPLPEVIGVTDYILCELNTDGFGEFDLESKTDEILNGQDSGIFVVTYHETQADAQAAMNALVSPYTNLTNPQAIFFNITNTDTGCDAIGGFSIEVQEAAEANSDGVPILYEICDDNVETDGDPSNDSAQFDLTTQDAFVLDGQDPANYTVTYYATLMDAELMVNPLPTLYENTSNPQVIYARVDNDTPGAGPIALDLTTLTDALDVNGDGVFDTIDTDADGVFDLLDVNGDGISDGFDTNGDGIIDFIDLDGDGVGDLVDLNNDGIVDNEIDSSSCYAIAEVTLQVNQLPVFDLEDEYILCVDTNGSEVINQPILETGLSATDYSFVWSLDGVVLPGETGSSLTPTQGGSYTVVVSDITSSGQTMCSAEDTAIVTESSPASVSAVVTSAAFAENHVIEVTAVGSGVYEYSLDDGPWQESNIFTNVTAGEHLISVRDIRGCGIGTASVLVIDYPKYFTPNGDGNHDTWNIISIASQPNAKIYIFDRYGKLLKQISPTGQGWDGTFNGAQMPSSDYWFTIQYNEPLDSSRRQFKAHFTLKR